MKIFSNPTYSIFLAMLSSQITKIFNYVVVKTVWTLCTVPFVFPFLCRCVCCCQQNLTNPHVLLLVQSVSFLSVFVHMKQKKSHKIVNVNKSGVILHFTVHQECVNEGRSDFKLTPSLHSWVLCWFWSHKVSWASNCYIWDVGNGKLEATKKERIFSFLRCFF